MQPGFEGKVIVIYDVPSGQQALNADGKLVIVCDSSGVAKIQEKPNEGSMSMNDLVIVVSNHGRSDTVKYFYDQGFLTDPKISMYQYCANGLVSGNGIINGTNTQVSYVSFLVFRKKNYDSVSQACERIFAPDAAK